MILTDDSPNKHQTKLSVDFCRKFKENGFKLKNIKQNLDLKFEKYNIINQENSNNEIFENKSPISFDSRTDVTSKNQGKSSSDKNQLKSIDKNNLGTNKEYFDYQENNSSSNNSKIKLENCIDYTHENSELKSLKQEFFNSDSKFFISEKDIVIPKINSEEILQEIAMQYDEITLKTPKSEIELQWPKKKNLPLVFLNKIASLLPLIEKGLHIKDINVKEKNIDEQKLANEIISDSEVSQN